MINFDAIKVKGDIIQWIRDWFELNGQGCNAVIGISGGKDSSVVAALCVEALGRDRVIGVLMPNHQQSDISDAYNLVDHLEIDHTVINIGLSIDNISSRINSCCLCRKTKNSLLRKPYKTISLSEQAKINLPPRIRMATLYAISQSVNGRVANTCNLSEEYVGYSTRWGDNAGDFSPLANLTSDEVIAIGDACGLPYELTHKVPSDGLCGKTDEDNLGFAYEVLNRYIRTGICEDEDTKNKIDVLHTKNRFKQEPIPSFCYMSTCITYEP